MPLFDPDHTPDVPPHDALIVVHRFLERCLRWADERELPKRTDRVAEDPSPQHTADLHAWAAYRAFTAHALRELEDGTLDHWFDPPNASEPTDPT